jgi:hypothetical protein
MIYRNTTMILRVIVILTIVSSSTLTNLSFASQLQSDVVLVDDSTLGYYNNSLGTILDGTQPQFPPANNSGGDPIINPAPEPNLTSVDSILGNWLISSPIPLNSNWSAIQEIPKSWAANIENAIIYPVDAGIQGYSQVIGNFGVDNGIFVWVNGEYKFGALGPGAVSGLEYKNIDLGSFSPGMNYIQILREDHSDFGGFTVYITGTLSIPSKRIGIQAGHYQQDSGAVCSDGTREVDINIAVANKTAEILRGWGYTVDVLPAPINNVHNYIADVFVALHTDQCASSYRGYKISRWKGQAGSGLDGSGDASDRWVKTLWSEYGYATGLNRDVIQGHYAPCMREYYALNPVDGGPICEGQYNQISGISTNTPGAIIEMGWLSGDYDFITSTDGQLKMAKGIANAVDRFLGGHNVFSTVFLPMVMVNTTNQTIISGKWYWAQTSGPYWGYFYITQTAKTFSGTLDDVWEGTYGDKVINGVINGTSFSFTRDGKYGIQFWYGTIDINNGVMEINNGLWQKQGWPSDYWLPFYAKFISPNY